MRSFCSSLFYSLPLLILLVCCKKPLVEVDELSEEAALVVEKYKQLTSNGNNNESFLFFSDPHLLGRSVAWIKDSLVSSFVKAKEVFDLLPLDFCLCGGDWLNAGDTQDLAKEKLLLADERMKQLFSPYYKMMGNHDTNYQGIVSDYNKERGDLPQGFIDNYLFSETGKAYYSFSTGNSQYYIFDSGLDWDTSLDDYRIEQLCWFAFQLSKCVCPHIIIGIHMFYNDVPIITPMAEEITRICESFNTRGVYKSFGKEFDFSNAIGMVHLILTGHCHVDFSETFNGIPVVGITKYNKESRSFDVCIINYDTGFINMIRVGSGEDRNIKI